MGITSDPRARQKAHNDGLSPHTARYRPWRTLVVIEFDEEAPAMIKRHCQVRASHGLYSRSATAVDRWGNESVTNQRRLKFQLAEFLTSTHGLWFLRSLRWAKVAGLATLSVLGLPAVASQRAGEVRLRGV